MAGTTEITNRTIFRKEKRTGYTVVDNGLLNDAALSFKAVGLLVFLLSKPDDWRFNYRHIATTHTDGEAAVRAGMKELQGRGYLTRERERQDDGTFAWVVTVHEERVTPCGGSPRMENPGVGNDHLLSTEGASTEKHSLTLLSEPEPPADTVAPAAPSAPQIEADFLEWYSGYPVKKSKGAARKAYKTARKKVDAQTLLTARDAFVRLMTAQRVDKDYIKHPSTWLNGECWEDEEGEAPNPFEAPPMRFG